MDRRPVRIGVVTTSYPRDAGDFAGWFVAERVRAAAARPRDTRSTCSPRARARRCGTAREGRLALTRLAREALGGRARSLRARRRARGARARAAWPRSPGRGALLRPSLARGRQLAPASRWDRVESHWLAPCALAAVAGGRARLFRTARRRTRATSRCSSLLAVRPLARCFAPARSERAPISSFVSEESARAASRRSPGARARRPGLVSAAAVARRQALVEKALRPKMRRGRKRFARPPTAARLLPTPSAPRGLPSSSPSLAARSHQGLDVLVRACAPRAGDATPLRVSSSSATVPSARACAASPTGSACRLSARGRRCRATRSPHWLRLADVLRAAVAAARERPRSRGYAARDARALLDGGVSDRRPRTPAACPARAARPALRRSGRPGRRRGLPRERALRAGLGWRGARTVNVHGNGLCNELRTAAGPQNRAIGYARRRPRRTLSS